MFDLKTIAVIVTFLLTFGGIFSGKIHRAIASFAGAITMIVVGEVLGFYSQQQALKAINFNTLELLLGMMIIVGLLSRTGFFEYISIRVAKKTGGDQFTLFLALCGLTAVASAILDNVTTIVLVAPMTLAIADVLGISPIPFLIGEAIMSIIGGMATLVGDPPNIIIGSAAGLSFNSFLTHLAPASITAWIASALSFKFIFRFSPIPSSKVESLREMDARKAYTSVKTSKKLLVVIGGVVILYLIHSYIHIEAGLVALIGATTALLWIQPNVKEVFENIEWDALVFLTGLFVVVGGLESAGLLDRAAHGFGIILKNHELIAPIGLLWIAGIISAIVDNIPFTVAMVPIIIQLQSTAGGDLLWWSLAMGAALGGAASPVGSSSNVVAMSVSERTRNPIKSLQWLKVGVPISGINLCIGTLFVLFMYWMGY